MNREEMTDAVGEERLGELETAVARGAGWLDEEVPDWRTRLDPATLDMADPALCVAGQTVPVDVTPAPDWWHEIQYGPWADKAGYNRVQLSLGLRMDEYGFVGNTGREDAVLKVLWLAAAGFPADDDRA